MLTRPTSPTHEQVDEIFRDGTVKQDHSNQGIKIKIDTSKMEEKKASERAQTMINFSQLLNKSTLGQKEREEREFRQHINREDRKQQARTGRKAGSPLVKLNVLLGEVLSKLSRRDGPFAKDFTFAVERAGSTCASLSADRPVHDGHQGQEAGPTALRRLCGRY